MVLRTRSFDMMFVAVCTVIYTTAVFLWPPYYDMLSPDSNGYLQFSPSRPALYPLFLWALGKLHLSVERITDVQIVVFSGSLTVLLFALRRASMPRWLIAFITIALIHPFFSSYHRVIQAESLYFSLTMISLAFWFDYFRTRNLIWLSSVSLCIGLMIGIRPAAVALLPMLPLGLWLFWSNRKVRRITAVAMLALPAFAGLLAEHTIHRFMTEEPTSAEVYSYLPNTMTAQAAMLVRSDMRFSGPHAKQLGALAEKFNALYGPVQTFVGNMPALPARAVIEASFENVAVLHVLGDEMASLAAEAGIPVPELRKEFAKQVMLQNPSGFIRLSLLHYVGYWSLVAPNFPPFARAIDEYSKSLDQIPLAEYVKEEIYRPKASLFSIPNFLPAVIAGVVTFLLSLYLVWLLATGRYDQSSRLTYLSLAAFFGAMCQIYILTISLITAAQPRYFMAIYPQLVVIAALLLFIATRRAATRSAPSSVSNDRAF